MWVVLLIDLMGGDGNRFYELVVVEGDWEECMVCFY